MQNSTQPTLIEMTQGDTAPAIIVTCVRKDGTVVSLVGATVNLYIRHPKTKQYTNTGHTLCTITNAAQGQAQYAWQATDLPVAGIYKGLLVVSQASGTQETQIVNISAEARD